MADRRTGGQADRADKTDKTDKQVRTARAGRSNRAASVPRWAGAVLMVAATLGPVGGVEAQGGKAVGTVIEAVTVNDLDGTPFDFSTVLGKRPVLVQFWATWCSVCEGLMPSLRAAAAEFGDRVEFIGVNVTVNQSPARVRRYLEEHNPPFRTLYDTRGAAVRAFEAPATGFVAIVGADGRVAYTGIGERQDIAAALRGVVK